MNLVKWNPWKEMETVSDRIQRLFDDTFVPAAWMSRESALRDWRPKVDIYDHDEKIVIEAEIPGVDKKNIHVEVENGVLTLSGKRSHEKEIKEENYHRRERVHGEFHRSFTLPDGLNPEKIEADFKNGLLKIEIPKPEETQPKKIAVH